MIKRARGTEAQKMLAVLMSRVSTSSLKHTLTVKSIWIRTSTTTPRMAFPMLSMGQAARSLWHQKILMQRFF